MADQAHITPEQVYEEQGKLHDLVEQLRRELAETGKSPSKQEVASGTQALEALRSLAKELQLIRVQTGDAPMFSPEEWGKALGAFTAGHVENTVSVGVSREADECLREVRDVEQKLKPLGERVRSLRRALGGASRRLHERLAGVEDTVAKANERLDAVDAQARDRAEEQKRLAETLARVGKVAEDLRTAVAKCSESGQGG